MQLDNADDAIHGLPETDLLPAVWLCT